MMQTTTREQTEAEFLNEFSDVIPTVEIPPETMAELVHGTRTNEAQWEEIDGIFDE